MTQSVIEFKAKRLDSFVRDKLIEPHGLVLSFVDSATGKPFCAEEFGLGVDRMRHPPALGNENFGSYFAYENCGMCTGAWLAAQVLKYQVTQDDEVLRTARAAFVAIRDLYQRSQSLGAGFFSKFHNGRLSTEISTDQCLYAAWALDQFGALATKEERGQIAQIIEGIAKFWMDRDYKHPYRDRDFEWPWPANRFPPLLWLAWRHTKRQKYYDEFERLAALQAVRDFPPFFSTTISRWRGSGAQGHWPFKLEQAAQGQLSLAPLLLYDAPHRSVWLSQLKELILSCLPDLGEDCLGRGEFTYDEEAGTAREVETPYHSGGKPNPVWEAKGFVSAARSGNSPTMFARALLAADPLFPEFGWKKVAGRILEKMDIGQMLYKIDPKGHLPENQKWLERCLSGDAVVNWLWSYWLAKAQNQTPKSTDDRTPHAKTPHRP